MKNLIKNVSWLTGGQIITRALKLTFLIVIARLLGFEQYGEFIGTVAFSSLFFIVASFFHTLTPLQKKFAESESEELHTIFTEHRSWRVFVAMSALFGSVILGSSIGYDPFLLLVLGFSLSCDFLRDIGGVYLLGKEYMREEAISFTIQSFVLLATLGLFFLLDPTPLLVAIGYGTASLTGVCTTYLFIRQKGKQHWRRYTLPTFGFFRDRVREGFGFGLTWALLVSFSFQWIIMLLGHFSAHSAAVGMVGFVLQLVQVSLVPWMMLGATLLSRSVQHHNGGGLENFRQGILLYLSCIVPYTAVSVALFSFCSKIFLSDNTISLMNQSLQVLTPVILFGSALVVLLYLYVAKDIFPRIMPIVLCGSIIFLSTSLWLSLQNVFLLLPLFSVFYAVLFFALVLKGKMLLREIFTSRQSHRIGLLWIFSFFLYTGSTLYFKDRYGVSVLISLIPSLFALRDLRAMVKV